MFIYIIYALIVLPFNFHHLYYFYTIAKIGSVSRAAKELRLAQPTLSAQLKQFEHYLDRKLFERRARRLELTEEGHHILSYANMIFDVGRELADSLSDTSLKGRYRIQIGITHTLPRAIADALIQFLFRIYPSVHLNIVSENIESLIKKLSNHALDAVLSNSTAPSSSDIGIERKLLATVPVAFCAHPDIAKKVKKFPEDLSKIPLILPTSQSEIYHSLQESFLTKKIRPNIVAEIQDGELVGRLVLAKKGAAPLNIFSVLQAPIKQKLVLLAPKVKLPVQESIYFYFKSRKRPHPLVESVLKDFHLNRK